MNSRSLEQFLDTGWFSEATLFYNGCIYWCEASYDEKTETNTFFVDKWTAVNEGNRFFHSVLDEKGNLNSTRVYQDSGPDLDMIKKKFLLGKLFDGKSFWEVESELEWLDEDSPTKPAPV